MNGTNGSPLAARAALNPLAVIVIVVILFISVLAIYLITKVLTEYKKSPAYLEKQKHKPTTFTVVNEVAKAARLLREERDLLWAICKEHPVPNLRFYLKDPITLEPLYKEEFSLLDQADDEKGKTFLFSLRGKIRDSFTPTENMNTTRKIDVGTELTYTASQGVHYRLTLLEKQPDSMILAMPQAMIERGDKPKELSKISLIFIHKTGNAYQLETRAVRYQTDKSGTAQMIVMHSEKLSPLQRRQTERKDIEQPCLFSSVTVKPADSEKNTKVDYKASDNMHKGILMDISTGGCRVTTTMPIKPEQFIFIRGKLNAMDEDVAIGSIVRTTKRLDGLFILHIRFVKIERAVENRIQALVCDYTLPELSS
ncbi:MAG: PilZ domain-containing protein [Treponema sp.]|nr:PilZ domain-containing protein [Treponema sp.]